MIEFIKGSDNRVRPSETQNVHDLMYILKKLKLVKKVPINAYNKPWWTRFYWETVYEMVS